MQKISQIREELTALHEHKDTNMKSFIERLGSGSVHPSKRGSGTTKKVARPIRGRIYMTDLLAAKICEKFWTQL